MVADYRDGDEQIDLRYLGENEVTGTEVSRKNFLFSFFIEIGTLDENRFGAN